jgi:sigma-E factor negative regulatory protein RseB
MISLWKFESSVVLALAFLCLWVGGPLLLGESIADETSAAVGLLNAMRTAMSEQTYRGIVAYSKDNQVENMEVVHAVADGIEREKLVSLNGPMREVVRHGEVVRCYRPDEKSVMVESKRNGKASFLDLPEDFSQLQAYYEFRMGRRDRVAQRDAQEIDVVPKDNLRYARKVWVDLASHLPVKVELLDADQRVMEQMVFSSLTLPGSIPEKDLESSSRPDQLVVRESTRKDLPIDSLHWTLQDVPMGFRIVSFTRITQEPEHNPVDHLLVSDGLSSISVYFEQRGTQAIAGHPSKMGAINTYSRRIGEFLVTTVGEVPAKTVETIGNGIRFQE